MSIPIEKTNVVNGNNIEAQDILNIIEALDGTTDNSITITGPLSQGKNTVASGDWSHAEGDSTIAIGDFSHAEGYFTIASGSYQHVSGKYNTQGDTTSLFIVGNGTEGSRADAFKVTHSSSIVIPIQKTVPTYSGSNGEMVPIETGGGHFYLYMFVSGLGWKRTEFT